MTAPPIPRPVAQSPALGILLRVLAMALMAVLAAIVKACAERGVPVLEIIFFRNAFAFILANAVDLACEGGVAGLSRLVQAAAGVLVS